MAKRNVKVKPRAKDDGVMVYDVIKTNPDGTETLIDTFDTYVEAKDMADLGAML